MSRILDFLFLQLVSGSFVLFRVDKCASVILVGKYRTPFELSPALLPRETFDSEYREQVVTDLLPPTVRRGSVLIVPLTYPLTFDCVVERIRFTRYVRFIRSKNRERLTRSLLRLLSHSRGWSPTMTSHSVLRIIT